MKNSDLLTIKARFKFYPTEKGGRKTPINSGYRPNHVFEYKGKSNDLVDTYIGDISFNGQKSLSPGESIVATVRFLKHGDIERFIQIGRIWWIHEANIKIGEAEIIEINE